MRILILNLIFLTSLVANAERKDCLNGAAGEFACEKVDLLSVIDLKPSGILAKGGNDIWGWTDSKTGKEYALMGMTNKTSIVDISDPVTPVHVADIATHTYSSIWRDIKVYKDHAFIVSEAYGHGMQVVDLTALRGLSGKGGPQVLQPVAHYGLFGNAHNIAINEDSGYAYAVGTNTCDKGAHVVDIRAPSNPQFSTCLDRDIFDPAPPLPKDDLSLFAFEHGDTYTHDIQCVLYKGPSRKHKKREICVASNEDSVNIVDVTNKADPKQLAAITYRNVSYTHQGWLSVDQRFFFLGDELDEMDKGVNTTTYVFDLQDLEKPEYRTKFVHPTKSIDHNMYTNGKFLFQANYLSGIRVLDVSHVEHGVIKQHGFFDTNPDEDEAEFEGVWSVYPYFKSGSIVGSHIDGRLFVVKLRD